MDILEKATDSLTNIKAPIHKKVIVNKRFMFTICCHGCN